MLERTNVILGQVASIHEAMGFDEPPFDFSRFLEVYPEFTLIPARLPAVLDGRLRVKEDHPFIFYNVNTTRGRQRFTIAHEIGHAFLHTDVFACRVAETFSRHRTSRRPLAEREADFFASELLIPMPMLDRHTPAELDGMPEAAFNRLVVRLSRTFNVSKTAMRIKLKDLRHIRKTTLGKTR
jgi:Zn-dependent peptidase ImmA (M78 family)